MYTPKENLFKVLPFKVEDHPDGYNGFSQIAAIRTNRATSSQMEAAKRKSKTNKKMVESEDRFEADIYGLVQTVPLIIMDNFISVRNSTARYYKAVKATDRTKRIGKLVFLNLDTLSDQLVYDICSDWDGTIPISCYLTQKNLNKYIGHDKWQAIPATAIDRFIGGFHFFPVTYMFSSKNRKTKRIQRATTNEQRLHCKTLYQRADLDFKRKNGQLSDPDAIRRFGSKKTILR